jgi:hypothetical protein
MPVHGPQVAYGDGSGRPQEAQRAVVASVVLTRSTSEVGAPAGPAWLVRVMPEFRHLLADA